MVARRESERSRSTRQTAEWNRGRTWRIRNVQISQTNSVNQNVVAANQRWRFESARRGSRDDFFEWLIEIRRIAIDRVNSVAFDADAADVLHHSCKWARCQDRR